MCIIIFYFWFLNLKILCNYEIVLQQAEHEVENGKDGKETLLFIYISFMPLWQSPAARLLVNLLWAARVASVAMLPKLSGSCSCLMRVCHLHEVHSSISIVIFHIWYEAAQCWQKISPLNEYKRRQKKLAEILLNAHVLQIRYTKPKIPVADSGRNERTEAGAAQYKEWERGRVRGKG